MSQLSKAYEKNKKVQQSIASNLQEDEPKKQLTTVSMTSSKQQLKQVLQEQKQREKNPVQRKNTKIGASQSPKFVSTTFISPVQPIVSIQPSSNLQRLLAKVETDNSWYSGSTPTRSEAAARIYTISQTDPERARKLNQAFSQLQRDPSSQFYNPYGAATNKAIQELANLGVDMSGGITEDWLAKNSWLKAYYRTSGNSGTPLAPTKSSTAEQNAAYYYYQILKAQDTTNQAEAEWKALQEEIGYWANRKDRNYSDDQIISRIDWSKYKTLARMDDGAASGVPLTLNSAIGYSQDALKGVIWAARNGSTGNPLADSAKAVLGAGKTWQEDKKISAKLDPSSKAYSPYSVGSTLDDAALYFGVDSFSRDWLEKNRGILAGNDATAKKMYQTVYNAEQTTLKAEQELDELHANIDRYLESTTDPDQILRMIDGEYKTLDSLDESMREGKLIGTTRAIDYRKQDIELEVRRRCLAKNMQINGAEYVRAVWKLLGLPEVKTEAISAVGASRDNAINAGGATIADAGTDEEKTVFKTAYSSDFDTYLTQIKGAMDSGVSDPQGGYDYTLKRADQYAAENYMDAMDTVLTYEEAQQAKDEAIKKLNDLGVVYDEDGNIDMTNSKGSLIVPGADTAMAAAGMSDAPRKLRKTSDDTADEIDMLRKEIASGYGKDEKGKRVKLTDAEIELKHSQLQALLHPEAITATQKEINQLLAVVDESTETMERTQKSYDKANITLKNITEGYAVADRMQALTGVKAGDSDSTLAQMTYLFSIARNYEPTEYRSANLYALAMDGQGATYDETAAAARQGMAQNKQMIEQINFALGELESKGAHLPDDKMENVKRYVAALERDVQDAEYFLLRENDDYYQESQDVSNEIFAAWQDYNELNPLGMLNPFADRKGYTALDNVVAIRLEQLQMEEASKTIGRNLKSDKVIMSTGNPAKDGYYTEDINQLSKNECMTYLYIRGKEGVDAAQEYYDHLTNAEYGVINMRRNLDWTAKAQEFADQNAVTGALASALTVIASPLNVGGMVESIKADVLGQELNPYARGFVYGNMSGTARATVEENISESVGGGARGWLLGKLYNALMSYGDSVVSSYFMGDLGAAAGSGAGKLLAKTGLTENYVNLASKVVSSFVTASGQGMQAVGNTVMDARLRGATATERRILGLVTFLAETATEAIEVETIDSAIHGGAEREFKDTFKKLLFNMFNEGAGEGVSELVEGMADKVVMDYKSNWAESVQRYIDEGMTKKQAEDAAWKEIMWNAVEAAAVGGISGGLGTGLGYVQGRIFGDGSQTQDAVQPTAETVQQTQQTAQETVQQTAQEQTQQEAPTIAQETQNAEVENVAPETAEAAQTPNTKEETQTFDTGERLTQYEVNEKTVRQVTALTASLEADEASQTATIGAALLGDNATPQETAFASAAAQHMTDTLGSDTAVRFTRDVLLLDSDTNGVRAALTVAALNKGGNASQVAQRMAQEGVTAEGIQELKAAADLDVQDANVTAQMQQTVQENQVALRTAQLIGDGALKAVQPYETAVAQAKSVLRQAQGELRRQVKRREGLGQNLLSLQERINSGTATPQLLDTFRSTVKDIEGQIKVVNEYTQRVANAEQSLHDAQNQLDTVRDDTLRQVRQQAQQDVADMQAQQIAEQEAAKPKQNAEGSTGTVYDGDNNQIDFHYALVDADSLNVSNLEDMQVNPNYPQELQPRDRSREAGRQQVDEIASNLNPARLGESADIQNGAPIIGSDNVVESGNGRVMAIKSAMQKGMETARQYTQWLRDNAAKFGISADQVQDNSVLVRVRDTDVDRAAFVQKANESTTSSYSQTETAKSDAAKMTGDLLNLYTPTVSGKINTRENASFLARFLETIIPASDRASYLQADGTLSQNGLARVQNALFEKAYGNTALTAALSESTDESTKSVIRALTNVAARVATVSQEIQDGKVFDLNIASDLAQAAERYMAIKKQGLDVSDYLAQFKMPGYEAETETAASFMRMFDQNKRSAAKITNAINAVLDQVESYGNPNQTSMLGENTAPDLNTVVESVIGGKDFAEDTINAPIQASYGVPGVTGTARSDATGPVVSPIVTAQKLAKALGVGMTLGTRKMDTGSTKIPKAVRGYYEQNAKYIAVRSNEASSYAVTMHEAGHAIADKIGLTGTQEMVDRLNPVFAKNYNAQQLPGEAFAEFVSLYMRDSRMAEDFAGSDFMRTFEAALRRADIDKAVHQARDQIQAYSAATTLDRAKAGIIDQADAQRKDSMAEKMRDFVTNVADWTRPLEDVDKAFAASNDGQYGNVRQTAKKRNFADRIVESLFTNAMTDADHTIIGDSFSAAFEGIDGKNADDFIAYGLLKHSLSRDVQGKQVFANDLTHDQRVEAVRQIEEDSPQYKKALDKFEKTWHQFMQAWMVDTGYLSQESFDKMNEMYPYWLPTVRVRDGKAGSGGKRGTFTIHQATGSDLQIINPIDTIANYVTRIVDMNLRNNVAIAFDEAYQTSKGMGIWAREITQDMRRTSVSTEDVQQRVNDILDEADVDTDVIGNVLEAIGKEAVSWQGTNTSTEGDTLRVVRRDGTNAYYQFDADGRAIYEALTGNGKAVHSETRRALKAFSNITSFVSRMATTYAPTFAASNPIKDLQSSIYHGSWASNYLTGLGKWLVSAYEVTTNSKGVQDYKAQGGGGWNQIQTGFRKGADEYRGKLFEGYWKRDAKSIAKHIGETALDVVTLYRLNDIIETASRYAEYRFGKHDLSTPEGRAEAFQAAQDVTTDFANGGKGAGVLIARSIMPFLNPNIQGTYRAGLELSGRERGRLGARMTKRIVNTMFLSALASVIRARFGSDEDKDLYGRISDGVKTSNLIIPNVFNRDSDRRFVRIPISQDPLDQALYALTTSAIDEYNGDDDLITELLAGASQIVSNVSLGASDLLSEGSLPERLNGFMQGTIFGPAWGLITNQTYYGGKIVGDYLDELSPVSQYDETTNNMFIWLGARLGVSPKRLEYLYDQYTGYAGQLLMAVTDGDNALKTTLNAFHKRFTIDPAYTNDISSAYSDNKAFISQLQKTISKTGTDGKMLRGDLTEDERSQAYEEIKAMNKKGGLLKDTNDQISDLWNEIHAVQDDETKTEAERRALILQYRDQITDLQLSFNEQFGQFQAKYVTGENPLTKMLLDPQSVSAYTAYDKMDDTFKADEDKAYMQLARSAWEKTENESALPHPNTSFSVNKTTYEIGDDDWQAYTAEYKLAYSDYLLKKSAKWNILSDDEQVELLKEAHKKGHEAAKKWYMAKYGIKEKR